MISENIRLNCRQVGFRGEDKAVDFLLKCGIGTVCRNFYFKGGEIDLIYYDHTERDNYLCFCEVKYRKNLNKGYPAEAVSLKKQQTIIKGAYSYMNYHRIGSNVPIRFDVISIIGNEVVLIKNAFSL